MVGDGLVRDSRGARYRGRGWLFRYHVAIGAAEWPEQAVSKVMPFFLFGVMLLPRIKRVFAAGLRNSRRSPSRSPAEMSPLPPAPAGRPMVSLVTLLFLIVVCSNLVVDVADWGHRLRSSRSRFLDPVFAIS